MTSFGVNWKAAGKATLGIFLLVAICGCAVGLVMLIEAGRWRIVLGIAGGIVLAWLWTTTYLDHKRRDERATAPASVLSREEDK